MGVIFGGETVHVACRDLLDNFCKGDNSNKRQFFNIDILKELNCLRLQYVVCRRCFLGS